MNREPHVEQPVIVVHLGMDSNPSLASCDGRQIVKTADGAYPGVPRLLCPACHCSLLSRHESPGFEP